MRNFRELEVWKDARVLVKEIYTLTSTLPSSEKFGLVSQINRCSVSIPANIAEGSAKFSQKDFVRFLQISLGSSYELETHLILCEDLNFINSEMASLTIKKVQNLNGILTKPSLSPFNFLLFTFYLNPLTTLNP